MASLQKDYNNYLLENEFVKGKIPTLLQRNRDTKIKKNRNKSWFYIYMVMCLLLLVCVIIAYMA